MSQDKGGPESGGDTIGALVRKIRKSRKLTLEQLSQLTAIPVSSLSRIENTRLGLTVEKVRVLARALEVSPESLLNQSASVDEAGASRLTPPGQARFSVDRARGREVDQFGDVTLHYMFDKEDERRSMDCLYFQLQPISVWDSEFVRHPGEKVLYVVSGDIVAYIEGRSPMILEAGDAAYMDSHVWHSVVAINGRPAELLATYYHGGRQGADAFEAQPFTPESWAALQQR
jgi:transcriptional regulator with XRE-family HTH domain